MRISDARCHAAQGESGICVILKWRLWGILLSVGEKELLKIRNIYGHRPGVRERQPRSTPLLQNMSSTSLL